MNKKGGGLLVVVIILAVVCIVFLAAGFMLLRGWGGFDWWRDIPESMKNVEEFTISQTQQIPVKGYDEFEFSSVSADMDIVYADTDTITVELKGSYRSGKGQVELRKETSGDKVHIYVHYPKRTGLFSWNETELTITMPMDIDKSDLTFNSVSGEVDIPSGLQVRNISINSTSGDVQADDVQCEEFKYGNVSGDLDLTGYISERISVDTVSGNTDIRLYGQTENIDVNGVSGDVKITLEKDIDFTFDFDTVSGDFNCEIPVYSQGGRNDRSGYTDTNANTVCSGTTTYMDGDGGCDDISIVYQPVEATLTDIADGTIAENLVNTANPWADNEVVDDITVSSTKNITSTTGIVLGNDIKFYAGGATFEGNATCGIIRGATSTWNIC